MSSNATLVVSFNKSPLCDSLLAQLAAANKSAISLAEFAAALASNVAEPAATSLLAPGAGDGADDSAANANANNTATSLPPATNETLVACFEQYQLTSYYATYDPFVGFRVASALSVLFAVFILFVIFKTKCRSGARHAKASYDEPSAP